MVEVYKGLEEVPYIPAYVDKSIKSIPPYEDSGVKFQGKYKVQTSGDGFELKRQETRFYVLQIPSGSFGNVTFPRSPSNTTFYCTKAIIMHRGASTFSLGFAQFHLADVNGTTATQKLYYWPVETNQNLVLDFTDCPRKFTGQNFNWYCQTNLGGTEYIIVQLFGWEEAQ